jgi:hypothetical protein
MKSWFKIIWLIFKREIVPASDGVGLKQLLREFHEMISALLKRRRRNSALPMGILFICKSIVYRMLIFYLPILGITFLLILVSYSGLCLVGAGQGLERRFEEFKTSPFTALFGKAGFYLSEKGDDSYFNLYRWMNISVKEVFPSSEFPDGKLFSSVKPFSKVYGLTVRNKDGAYLPDHPGMALHLQGEYADEPFIMKIKEIIIKGDFPDETEQGIIVSVEGMKRFGYKENYPDFLWIKLSELKDIGKKDIECIPLRVCVVEKLPCQFLYVLSINQYRLLNTEYYHLNISGFDIIFANDWSQSESEEIKKILPVRKISGPFTTEGKKYISVNLSEEISRIDILKKLEEKKLLNKNMNLKMGLPHYDLPKNYNAAIFHLNFQVMSNITKEYIYAIQNYMDSKGIAVEGELVELLSEMIHTQNNLKNLQGLFDKGLFGIGLVLFLFFAVIIHNRIHRIGTIRMLGVSDRVFVEVYFLVGLSLVAFAFIAASVLICIYRPADLETVSLNLSVLKLFVEMLCIAELGFVIPVLLFLGLFRPSEMIAYRS